MPTPDNQIPDALAEHTQMQTGAYIIGPVLGQGSFGMTYRADDAKLNRTVAIKELFVAGSCRREASEALPQSGITETAFGELKTKFLEEARSLAQFRHPGIVNIYNFFEENNTAYMVMEYLDGQTLRSLVEERGALPEAEAIGIIKKAADALSVVHEAKMLHRDINPGNIMLCDEGRVVLIDFGLTKKIEESANRYGTVRLNRTINFGTEGYAPPEQYVKQATLGTFTDIYSLAATLYYLLTAKEPDSAMERQYRDSLQNIKSLNGSVSQTVSDAVNRAMALRENERPQTVSEFLQLLEAPAAPVRPAFRPQAAPSVPQTPATPAPTVAPRQSLVARLTSRLSPALPASKRIGAGSTRISLTVSNVNALEAAIRDAEPGDTIWIKPGTYRLAETLYISKSLALRGNRGRCQFISAISEALICLSGDYDWEFQDIIFERSVLAEADLLTVTGGQVKFKGCAFIGVPNGTSMVNQQGTGLNISGNAEGFIENCEFRFHSYGIWAGKQARLKLESSRFEKNSNGIVYLDQAEGLARDNVFMENWNGIKLRGEAHPTLISNRCEKNHAGIIYQKNAGGMAQGNTCVSNTYGLKIEDNARPKLVKNYCSNNAKGDVA